MSAPSSPPPTLYGIPLSIISLVTLVVQNSMLVLVMKYSRVVQSESKGPDYLASTAVVMSEIIKLLISFVMYLKDASASSDHRRRGWSLLTIATDLFGPESDCIKITVPAALYVLQNNLQYLAVTNLDPATFQVSYQMKILTTAFFSVLLLKKQLSAQKWLSLVLLTAGIALVQLPSSSSKKQQEHTASESFIGLIAVFVSCLCSGLAGVWFEKVLKGGSKMSLWGRNIQLSAFSLIPAIFIGVVMKDGAAVTENGFFQGYTVWTWSTIACQAIGGIIVALVVKYADNILKGFATSISIIVSAVASIFLFGFVVTTIFCLGAGLVLYATHMYGQPDTPSSPPRNSSSSVIPPLSHVTSAQYEMVPSSESKK